MNNGVNLKEQIAACPFCDGSVARACEFDVDRWAVSCVQCEAIGPSAKSETDAVEKWALRRWKPLE